MNTFLVRYGHSVRKKKQYTKKTNVKYAVKAEISMKTKSFNDSAKRSAFSSRLAAKWRQMAFVYDVIGNMAIATSVEAKGDSSHYKRWVLRRW